MSRSIRKLSQRAGRLLKRPDAHRVRRMTIAVSWTCDCRCEMCGIWKIYREQPKLKKTELTASETVGLLSDAASLRALETINFTGGEPFIHREFVELALALEGRFPRVSMDITTTGQATKLIHDKLTAIGDGGGHLDRYNVCVSLDGVGDKHDEVRGMPGAFDKAMATVRMAREFGLGNLGLGFTILPSNYASLADAYQLSVDLGVDFTMRVAHFNAGMYDNADDAAEHAWTPDSMSAVESTVRWIMDDKLRRRGFWRALVASDDYFADRMLDYLRRPRRMMPCYSGTHSALLDPHGKVFPCVNLETSMGNARDAGFDAVWSSPEAKQVRADIAADRCECWTECESFLSLHTSPRYLFHNLRRIASRPRTGRTEGQECLTTG